MAKSTKSLRPAKALKMPKASHAELQGAIEELLGYLQLPFSPTDASRTYGPDGRPRASKVATGWPDITGCLPSGRLFAIEVKGPRDRIRPAQAATLERLQASGAAVLVAKSVEDAIDFLSKHLPHLAVIRR